MSFFKKFIVSILWFQAKIILSIKKPKIVAVTGNVGKTSTKDAIFELFSKSFYTRKSQKSFNSEIGVPLTIIGIPNSWRNPLLWILNVLKGFIKIFDRNYPEWLILEVGADRPRDIEDLANWIKPDIAVLTKIGEIPVHVEYFKDKNALIKEKSFILSAVKDGGTLILNADDEETNREMAEYIQGKRITTYGFNKNADVSISGYEILFETEGTIKKPTGISFIISTSSFSCKVGVKGALGKQHAYPVAVAVASFLSIFKDPSLIEKHFENYETPPGRMKIIKGIKNSTIIDDTYNASPSAVIEALNTLADIKTRKRKIVALGDMLELGKYSSEAHQKVGERSFEVADIICAVGVRARSIAESALNLGFSEKKIFQFDTSIEAGKMLQNLIKEGDIVLVKGSQGMRMEIVVEEIMLEPDRKKDLLVRQDEGWMLRRPNTKSF